MRDPRVDGVMAGPATVARLPFGRHIGSPQHLAKTTLPGQHHGLEDRHVEQLTLAGGVRGAQPGGERAHRGEEAAKPFGRPSSDLGGGTIGRAATEHRACPCLQCQIGRRRVGPRALQTERGDGDDNGVRGEASQLVRCELCPLGPIPFGSLNLDDLRATVGKRHGAISSRHSLRQVDDAQALERLRSDLWWRGLSGSRRSSGHSARRFGDPRDRGHRHMPLPEASCCPENPNRPEENRLPT